VLTLAGFAGAPASAAAPLLQTVRDELARYIREQHLTRPVVIGHSLGGFVALWLAASEPALLGGVVSVDALPYLAAAQDPAATVERTRPLAEQMRAMMAALSPEAFTLQTRAALSAMITDPADVAAVLARAQKSDPKVVAAAVYEMLLTDLRPAIARITAPTLVLVAGGGAAEAARLPFAAQYAPLPGAQLRVAERARHFIMLDDAAFFYAALDAFLAQLKRGA
jgi:pimeloyl-ACP methyl ester carboxylesterase